MSDGRKKNATLHFSVPAEVAEKIDDMVERAKQRGMEHATRSMVARSLLQVTLGVPTKIAAAHEVAMQAFAMQIKMSKRMRLAMLQEIEETLGVDFKTGESE